MNELHGPMEPPVGRVVVAPVRGRQVGLIAGTLAMCAFVVMPASAVGTSILAGGAALMLRHLNRDMPTLLQHDKVRPEMVAVGSVAGSLYIYDLVVDHALLPLSLDILSQPLMAVAAGTLVVLTAAIPAFAVSVWRFWQREML